MRRPDLEPVESKDPSAPLGSNQSGMRDRNERLVLSILRRQGALPKAEIARKTGLSAQTVSVIMRALEKDGFLVKGEKLRGRVGQPSVPMWLNPEGAYFFGLKVGRRSVELVLTDFVGQILARKSETYRYPTPAKTVAFARAAVIDLSESLSSDQRARIAGLGIASPYYLWEWATVIGVAESEMAVWKGYDLVSALAPLFDYPVYLGNDASCACAAELVFGQGPKPTDFLYLYIGYFVGGGVVLNGTLYTGSSGNAGAIGPFPDINPQNPRRQLVDVASLIGLERRLEEAGGDSQILWESSETWRVDQALIEDWLDEAGPAIARTILAAISLIDFSTIIIDGSMPRTLRDQVIARVLTELGRFNLSGLIVPEVLPGTIGADARPLGAASLPLLKRFALEG